MKRFLHSIFLLVILCPVKLQAQEGQPLDMLIASTADALIDSIYLFNHIRAKDVKFGHLYDTAMYIQTGSGFSNETVKYMAHKLNAVSTEKTGFVTIYTYQNDSEQMWKVSKKVKLDKKMNILGGGTRGISSRHRFCYSRFSLLKLGKNPRKNALVYCRKRLG